jgi:hypothetical protein
MKNLKEYVLRAARFVLAGVVAFAAATGAGGASTSDSVVQFKVSSAATRLSHDMKIAWAGPFNGTQCGNVTISPRTDKFPGAEMGTFKISVAQLSNLWLKAGDEVRADDAGCLLLVTAQYTDATFTRPSVP